MRCLPLEDPQFGNEKEKKTIKIYALKSEISKEIFVWKAEKTRLYQLYKVHVGKQNNQTKDLFERSELAGEYPKMYLLDTVTATEREAFRHCVAWTRYFSDKGFILLARKKILDYAVDLLPETQTIYDGIKDLPVEQVLTEEGLVVRNYRRKTKFAKEDAEKEESTLTIYLTRDERENVRKLAEEEGMSLSRYCKNMVLDGQIVNIETPPVWEYMDSLREAKIILRRTLYSIYQSEKYNPADLANIEKGIEKIILSEEKVDATLRKFTREIAKRLPK